MQIACQLWPANLQRSFADYLQFKKKPLKICSSVCKYFAIFVVLCVCPYMQLVALELLKIYTY